MNGSLVLQVGAVAALASFCFSLLIVCSQKWHGWLSHDHDLDGAQKFHTTAVPRIGGIAILAGIIVGLLIVAEFYSVGVSASIRDKTWLLLGASLPAFLLGLIEDFTKRISVNMRLSATICSSLIASAVLGATVDELDLWFIDSLLTIGPIAVAVTALVVAGGANAINIIDGFNGLSCSVALVLAMALGVLAWQAGDVFVTFLVVLGASGTIGFLLVNYPTGKLFLGDGGAYFLGFWLSEIAVLLLVRNPNINAWQVLSICAYPVIEVLFSIYRRRILGNGNPGVADAMHLHTLIYRRLVKNITNSSERRPWVNNSLVVCLILPVVCLLCSLSVTVGASQVGAISLVVLQVALYIACYRSLIRPRARNGKPRNRRMVEREPDAPVFGVK